MLSSGNGRHRRPRQAPAAMVTVAATGAGLALPLLGAGAGAAHAADAGTWDKVAVCETGGLWSADTHNGFFGGLAITQDTWSQYGGTAYAPRPDLASRSQQIAVAEKILADLGPDAWPGCDRTTGLLKDSGTPDVDPGTTAPATPAPTTPADPGTPADTGTPSATPTDPAVPPTPADTGTPSTAPSAPTTTPTHPGASIHPGTGTATTTPADPTAPAQGTSPAAPVDPTAPGTPTEGSGRHARPYSPSDETLAAADRATRTETTAITANTPDANSTGNTGNTASAADTDPGTYKVGTGDSLSGIAADHDVAGGWSRLYDANHQLIGDNPNLIKPGQILNLG
jgi:LysM repeat protein